MKQIEHALRLGETVRPFGVGALADVSGAALIAPDTSWGAWSSGPQLHCEALEAEFPGGEFRLAPHAASLQRSKPKALEYRRFPEWRFCDRCGRLSRKTANKLGAFRNRCAECDGGLVPMRFVAACDGGSHVQDIQWFAWTHRGKDVNDVHKACRPDNTLRLIRLSERGESLKGIAVACDACRRTRSLAALIGDGALKADGFTCRGKQPWQTEASNPCERDVKAVLRTATSAYLAETITAIDIPPASPASAKLESAVRQHRFFNDFVQSSEGPLGEHLLGVIVSETGASSELVKAIATGGSGNAGEATGRLKRGEWAAFLESMAVPVEDQENPDFLVRNAAGPVELADAGSSALSEVVRRVGAVDRVRIVTALRGFRRLREDADFIRADLSAHTSKPRVYPAMEQYGEGVLLQLDEDALADWEAHPLVRRRASKLAAASSVALDAERLPGVTPRWIALHTLAHLLIRRLSFASGYTSAAISERVYAHGTDADPEAGIFVYTAAGDAQGTLGGLVRLAEPRHLVRLVLEALEDAEVCSNDPVCRESGHAAVRANLAACHGCSLVAETSCEVQNRFLDRALLLGGAGIAGYEEMPGLMSGVLSER